jgi:hypothetical protein
VLPVKRLDLSEQVTERIVALADELVAFVFVFEHVDERCLRGDDLLPLGWGRRGSGELEDPAASFSGKLTFDLVGHGAETTLSGLAVTDAGASRRVLPIGSGYRRGFAGTTGVYACCTPNEIGQASAIPA